MNTSKSVTYCYDIVDGPSKSTLFDACQYAYNKGTKISVMFEIVQGYSEDSNDDPKLKLPLFLPIADILVTGIQHEDGSGESFNLEGYCCADIDYYEKKCYTNTYFYENYRFSAYYNTESRTGKFTLISN